MKEHTSQFKTQIKELGRQFKFQVIYGNTILEEELYGVTPHYEGSILKSTMKQLDINTTIDIPYMTKIQFKMALWVNNAWEWLDFGYYYVFKSEKQEDKGTYKLTCYDKLINAMKTYEGIEAEFPMTLREYLQEICDAIDIDFGSADDEFANYDREIELDRYIGLEEYTYRDVLDEIAQATGSIICLNSDDELIVKYINEGIDNYNTVEGTSFVLEDASSGMPSSITKIEGNTSQNGTPTPETPVEVNTVSKDNEIVVSNRNLLPTSSNSWESGQYNASGDKASYSTRIRQKKLLAVSPNTSYYFYNTIFVLRSYNRDKTFVRSIGVVSANTSYTTRSDEYFLGVTIDGTMESYVEDTARVAIFYDTETNKRWVAHEGNSYRVDLGGKNICPTEKMSTINGGYINVTIGQLGNVVSGEKYTLSFMNNSSYTNNVSVRIYYDNTYTQQTNGNLVANSRMVYTFTASNTGYVALSVKVAEDTTDLFTNIQLEKRKYSNRVQSLCT